jgi:hypothetical protein
MSKKKKKNNRTVRATPVNNGPKKEKKPLSPEAKDRIKTSFLTLVNNDACIKAGREFRGLGFVFLAVGFALTGVVTSAVPNLVTRLNVNYGSGLLNAPTFSYDQGLVNFSKALSEKGCTILISDEGKLEITTATYNAETTSEEARAKQTSRPGPTSSVPLRIIRGIAINPPPPALRSSTSSSKSITKPMEPGITRNSPTQPS